jgi:hypothetical protein
MSETWEEVTKEIAALMFHDIKRMARDEPEKFEELADRIAEINAKR